MRMSHNAEGAIQVIQEGLKPDRPHSFAQADVLVSFFFFFFFHLLILAFISLILLFL